MLLHVPWNLCTNILKQFQAEGEAVLGGDLASYKSLVLKQDIAEE